MAEYDPADWWKGEEREQEPAPEGVYVSGTKLPDGTYVHATSNVPISFTKDDEAGGSQKDW